MKNVNIITNKIVEERVKEYCRKIEENKLKNVKATIQISRSKININNRKKLYLEKLRNQEIERNNNILKKKLEGINKRERKADELLKQTTLQKANTNKKNFLYENIKKAKIKKEKKKANNTNMNYPLNDTTSTKHPKKILYKGYIDDSQKCYKFYTEVKVDDGSNLSIIALNIKSRRIKKFAYDKEKHQELLNTLGTYEEIAKNVALKEDELQEKEKRCKLLNKKREYKENEKPMRIKHRVMLENIEKTCDFYIKKYFNDDFDKENCTKEMKHENGSNENEDKDITYFKKRKNSLLMVHPQPKMGAKLMAAIAEAPITPEQAPSHVSTLTPLVVFPFSLLGNDVSDAKNCGEEKLSTQFSKNKKEDKKEYTPSKHEHVQVKEMRKDHSMVDTSKEVSPPEEGESDSPTRMLDYTNGQNVTEETKGGEPELGEEGEVQNGERAESKVELEAIKEVTEESNEVVEESNEVVEESNEVVEESNEVTEESNEVTEESKEVTEESNEVTEESNEVVEESKEVVEESKEVVEESNEVTEESNEVSEESNEVVEESKEVVEESKEVVEKSKEVVEESKEVVEESKEVVEE
ncbi:conserved Plasmodium protein, unknown function, partial [Plasmodium ovale curtisi]